MVIEDEEPLIELLTYNLEAADYQVSAATDGQNGLEALKKGAHDLLILDWGLPPGPSGLDVCVAVRKDENLQSLPIIFLTAYSDETSRVEGLKSGADDYVTKPFSVTELMERVKTVLRRSHGPSAADDVLTYADITFNLTTKRVTQAGQTVHLSPRGYSLLETLMRHGQRVLTRDFLIKAVWGREHADVRTVDVHVGRLRSLLKGDVIRTVRNEGYSLY